MTHSTHLDYATCAPIRDNVRKAMIDDLTSGNDFFDPRRLYDDAIKVRYEIEESRFKVARFFGCLASEVIFTSSSTESLATFAYGVSQLDGHVAVSHFESETIYATLKCEHSTVQSDSIAAFVSYAHPDTGRILEFENIRNIAPNCLIHLDARSASGYAKLNFKELDVDAMTVSSETWGGPVGISALILRQGLHIEPLIKGASQERARRSGAENTIAIKGFGELCKTDISEELLRYEDFKTTIISKLKDLNLEIIDENVNSLQNMLSTKIEGVAASAVVAEFNRRQINIHAGSSCGSEEFEVSQALLDIGLTESEAESVFRVSWGYATINEDVEKFSKALGEIIKVFRT